MKFLNIPVSGKIRKFFLLGLYLVSCLVTDQPISQLHAMLALDAELSDVTVLDFVEVDPDEVSVLYATDLHWVVVDPPCQNAGVEIHGKDLHPQVLCRGGV